MLKNKEDISENTLMVLNKATALYEIFKELNIRVNLKANDVSILSDNISKNDKKLLSILVAMFYVDCGAKKMLEDDVEIPTIAKYTDLSIKEINALK